VSVPTNPFIHTRVLRPDEVIDRALEVERLRSLAASGEFSRVAAPRRFGKTSTFSKLLADIRDDPAVSAGVLVDLFGVESLVDITIRLERAYSQHLQGTLRTRVDHFLRTTNVGLSLGVQGISVQLSRRTDVDPLPALHALLDLPRAVAEPGRRVLVIFDEFQDLDRVSGAVELVRSHIQHHGEVAGYCFAGSAPGMMRSLFGQRSQPLYGQAVPVEHGPLPDPDAADYITARFAEHRRSPAAALGALLAEARGHPQRLMLLAHNLFEETAVGGGADAGAFQRGLARSLEQLGDEFSGLWDGLGASERRVLRALADGLGPFTEQARRLHGLTAGAADRGLRNLRERGEVWPEEQRLVDPLLERWIRQRILG
jgi:uncharacterized protein